MRVLSLSLIILSTMLVSQGYCITQWAKGVPASGNNLTAYPAAAQANNSILDTLLSGYRRGLNLTYSSSSTIVASAGEVVASNVGGTVRLFLQNTVSSNVTFSNLDTGAEASSTTYYVYCGTSTATDSSCTFYISASSSAPTGVTYYVRLGSFVNDGSSNITTIANDNTYTGYIGSASSKSAGTTYQALTDGLLTGYCTRTTVNNGYRIYSDSNSSPSTVVQEGFTLWVSGGPNVGLSFAHPIKKGDYYKVKGLDGVKAEDNSGLTINFIPQGS